jgi:hypothetical protein
MTRTARELSGALDAMLFGPNIDLSGDSIVMGASSMTAPVQNVVPLFSEPEARDDGASATPVPSDVTEAYALDAADWPGAIQLVRDVGARVRRARDLAQELTRESQSLVQRSLSQTEAAEERARVASAAIQEAIARAEKAEEAARLAEARAERAEAQAQAAKAAEAEARLWLGRLYASLKGEFDSLTEDPRPLTGSTARLPIRPAWLRRAPDHDAISAGEAVCAMQAARGIKPPRPQPWRLWRASPRAQAMIQPCSTPIGKNCCASWLSAMPMATSARDVPLASRSTHACWPAGSGSRPSAFS